MVNEHGQAMPPSQLTPNLPSHSPTLSQGQNQGQGQSQGQSSGATRAAASGMPELLHGYQPAGLDEAVSDGQLRQTWRPLMGHLNHIGVAGLAQRRDQALRLIRDNGVTYTAHNEHSQERPWLLDIVPQVIGADEWRALARGVAQRARLQEALLHDCYGAQRVLREGLVPPAAILGHPQFLRPLHGVPVARRAVIYACDVVRGADGNWYVTGEHTQSPSGAGYALENRIVISRALADPYRECQVERVASFFISLRKTLRALSPHRHDDPRIVVLSPGPYSDSYFEHAYLARYLGFTLVEGADLTVRDDKVYLKNLGGLHRVDVILRRLADDFCDPLELRSDSMLGITGLTGVVRAGNVAMANALGSGLGENAALLPLGERLTRHLLGEELRLPAVPTVWNDAAALTARFDSLVIRPAFAARGSSVFAEHLGSEERTALLARIRLEPQAWIGQERIATSTSPCLGGQGPGHNLVPRPMSLRIFAVADADDSEGYAVMPGGLTRIGDQTHNDGIKDTWVLSAGPVTPVSLLQPTSAPVTLKRGGADLPSRVADNLFWLGRYAERCENLARLVREGLRQQADGAETVSVMQLIDELGIRHEEPDVIRALMELAEDPEHSGGIVANLANLRRSAFAVRDRLSNDTWRIIHRLDRTVANEDAIARLDRILTELAALAGMGMENTTRGPAWRFLDLGRRLERSQHLIELLRTLSRGPALLETLLSVADSSITYRNRYLTTLQPGAVLDLLLLDGTNPRSVGYQLARIVEHLGAVPGEEDRALPSEAQRLARKLSTDIDLADPEALCRTPRRAELHELLARTADNIVRLSDVITSLYLSHAVPTPTIH